MEERITYQKKDGGKDNVESTYSRTSFPGRKLIILFLLFWLSKSKKEEDISPALFKIKNHASRNICHMKQMKQFSYADTRKPGSSISK